MPGRKGAARHILVTLIASVGIVVVAGLVFHNLAGSSDNPGRTQVEGIAASDCAPWDGSATSIFLSAHGDLEHLPPTPPFLHLIVYEAGARLPSLTVELGRQESGSGLALRCTAAGDCATSNRGVIQFDATQTDSAVTGSYQLDFSGDSVSGRFRARWSSRAAICG